VGVALLFVILRPGTVVSEALPLSSLTTADGLSQASVHAIAQDKYGFMWFGTQEGLNRFDGYHFHTYLSNDTDETSISNNWVEALVADPQGFLWVATNSGGLNRLDLITGSVVRYQHDPDDAASLSSNRVRALALDGSGALWIGTHGGGLNRLDTASGHLERVQLVPDGPAAEPTDRIRALCEAADGTIWIGTDGAGLYRLDPFSNALSHYQHDPNNASTLSEDRVRSLYVDKKGRLWIGTYGTGLNRFIPETCGFQRYPHRSSSPRSVASNEVTAIHDDGEGNLWIGTDGGLSQWLQDSDEFRTYRHESTDHASLIHDRILSLFEDAGGVVWIGTYSGLNKWNPRTGHFAHYRRNASEAESLSSNIVTSFAEDTRGAIWIGTHGGGLNRMLSAQGQFEHYRTAKNGAGGLNDDRVMSLAASRDGGIWVGTQTAGLNHFDPETGDFSSFQHDPKDENSLSANGITALLEDRQGVLWVGTWQGGLNRYDPTTESITRFRNDPDDPQSLGSDRVVALLEDSSGALWIGTDGGGLNRMDRNTGVFERLMDDDDAWSDESSRRIWTIYEDSERNLWIGSQARGLSKWGAQDRDAGIVRFRHYGRNEGLQSMAVHGIQGDGRGTLWLSTNRGIMRFNPRSGAVKSYDVLHGLQGLDFNQGAHFRASDGRLYFGGSNGFNVFLPKNIKDNQYVPPVVLTSLLKFNQEFMSGPQLAEVDMLRLDHRDYVIAFEFSALDFTDSEKNQYRYKLEGFDDEWVDASNVRRATYTNLGAGYYKFRVKASNNDGVWNEQGVSLPVKVFPAPWRAWWAYLTYVTVTIVLIWTYIKMHIRRLERAAELKRVEEASLAKSQFLATMSHELRTPLNGVLGMARMLLETNLDDKQIRRVITIRRSAEALLSLLTNILDFSKIEARKIELESLDVDPREQVEQSVELLSAVAHEKGVEIITSFASDLPSVVRGDPQRLRQIVTNLVSNAIKFTEQGEVLVALSVAERSEDRVLIRCSVTDTGIGLSGEQQARIFQRFVQADGSTTRRFGGTGLGLAIVKDLVDIMGGEVGVRSKLGVGSEFWFTLSFDLVGGSRPSAGHEELRGRRVLIVDDNATARAVLEAQCAQWQMMCVAVGTGADALALLHRKLELGSRFDVILVDMDMAAMSGAVLRQLIRAVPDLRDTPIIMMHSGELSSVDTADDPQLFPLRKPVRGLDLLTTLSAAILGVAPTADGVCPGRSDTLDGHVLVVEDNDTNQEIARHLLEGFGCTVEVADSGSVALAAVSRDHFDLVLMDCLMPGMDGLETTRRLRFEEQKKGGHLPVIALTADTTMDARRACLDAGMDDFLNKPVEPAILYARVRSWLNTCNAQALVGTGDESDGTDDRGDPLAASSRYTERSLVLLDRASLGQLQQMQRPGQPDLVNKVIDVYLSTTPGVLARLAEAVAVRDSSTIRAAAHALKSSSAHVGALSLAALATQMEMKATDGALDGAEALHEEIERTFQALSRELRRFDGVAA